MHLLRVVKCSKENSKVSIIVYFIGNSKVNLVTRDKRKIIMDKYDKANYTTEETKIVIKRLRGHSKRQTK